MTPTGLRPETEATLLLCGGLARSRREEPIEPLNVREFNEVLHVLRQLSIPLGDLAYPEIVGKLEEDPAGKSVLDARIRGLLDRRQGLEAALSHWEETGIWVVDRSDSRYPVRYRTLLRDAAPPLLYGAGSPDALNSDIERIAVVGSREIDQDAESFARKIGSSAAQHGAAIISGGARGVDRASVEDALSTGGNAVAVLPGGLERIASARAYRGAFLDERFTVVSPYHPRAAFSAGNAMGRNRLIYCLAHVGVVVEASLRTGGTWAGATDVLKHGWVPIYVRQTGQPSPGNQELIRLGAHPLPSEVADDPHRFAAWLESSVHSARSAGPPEDGTRQLGLFSDT